MLNPWGSSVERIENRKALVLLTTVDYPLPSITQHWASDLWTSENIFYLYNRLYRTFCTTHEPFWASQWSGEALERLSCLKKWLQVLCDAGTPKNQQNCKIMMYWTSDESMKIVGEHNVRQMAAEAKKGGKGNPLVEKSHPLLTKEHIIHCGARLRHREMKNEMSWKICNGIPMNWAGDKPCLWWFSDAPNPDFVLASIKNGTFKLPISSRSHQSCQRRVSDASSTEYHEW